MTEIKRGMLKYYHRGLLNKKWKEYKFILYDSSLLTWYADVKHKKPDGMVLLRDVERYICVGPYTRFLPDFPHLDDECDQVALLAFPRTIKDRDRDIVWLLCADQDDLNDWMKLIVGTLPSYTFPKERPIKLSSASIDENIQTVSEENSHITNRDRLVLKTDTIGLPLGATLFGARLQGHAMNVKDSPLQKAGYDYGDTLWGTGEGWGYFSPFEIPGYAALGGSGNYASHNGLDEQRLQEIEDRLGEIINDEEVIEEITYELSKKGIDDKQDEDDDRRHNNNSDESHESSNDDEKEARDSDREQIKEDLQMIDSDIDD